MKLIIAYIKPEQLGDVKKELYKNQIYRISATNSLGSGRQRDYSENYRGNEIEVNLLKKVRLEIAVNDEFVDLTIDSIIKGAHTDHIGDGKIFVLNLEQCIRVRTRETGPDAIG